jgi:hypothetical protein
VLSGAGSYVRLRGEFRLCGRRNASLKQRFDFTVERSFGIYGR